MTQAGLVNRILKDKGIEIDAQECVKALASHASSLNNDQPTCPTTKVVRPKSQVIDSNMLLQQEQNAKVRVPPPRPT